MSREEEDRQRVRGTMMLRWVCVGKERVGCSGDLHIKIKGYESITILYSM
jgi:hypothetical protein